MDIWHYTPRTGELIGQGQADPDPVVSGGWLYPAYSTTLKPPTIVDGYARVFRGDIWTLVEDHRGEVWWTAEGQPVEITDLGDPRSAGLLPDAPTIEQPRPVIVLSRRQFYEALERSAYITEEEAEAAMSGKIPHVLSAAVDALDDSKERFRARMLLAGGAEFRRDHPLVEIIGAAHGQSAAQIDQFFATAAML